MIRLGLTGSIAMGKSTTATFFAAAGAPVYDADAAVHALYAAGGAAGPELRTRFPGAVDAAGAVDRAALKRSIDADPQSLSALEALVHPLLRAGRDRFVREAQARGASVAVLDIPLLFETGGRSEVDAVVVVTAPAAVQRARALARPGMDEAILQRLLARQTPDEEKRALADFLIDTSLGLEAARTAVEAILAELLQAPRRGA